MCVKCPVLKDEGDDERFSDWTRILFDQALLAEGGKLDDPAGPVIVLSCSEAGICR